MGVINTTPDSFSDGGALYRGASLNLDAALAQAQAMVEAGATILDVGGESTRPGALPVSEQEELDRVVPLVERIRHSLDVVISVDTSTPAVIRESAAAGCGLINDVRALQREGALEAAARTQLPVCLMHMQGEPGTMQANPEYQDVVADVSSFLTQRLKACEAAGISRNRVLLDPGFGFGKTVEHNLQLLAALPRLAELGLPILVGLSRKSLIGKLIGRDVDQRLPASLALAVLAVERGASIVRVHDVAETVDALAMITALREVGES
ncbi:dihydropteroate synthase [Parahalioglobus pacificus]|uniref:dihydropteroate synthase n=1 Tax=Parahalioglobus pacificus TaxID=930806 RepID=A0A919CLS4_9GAMM|nr:dihydropteroate synthase [Halioglobus pacificus]NQY02731.1 dihydropteroate synthase [Halieaceae bacterium]GHD37270.1 dihydropteroate synthase [Halioglobus pacificus]